MKEMTSINTIVFIIQLCSYSLYSQQYGITKMSQLLKDFHYLSDPSIGADNASTLYTFVRDIFQFYSIIDPIPWGFFQTRCYIDIGFSNNLHSLLL